MEMDPLVNQALHTVHCIYIYREREREREGDREREDRWIPQSNKH